MTADVTTTRKLQVPLSEEDAEAIVRDFASLPTISIDPPLVLLAIAAARRFKIAYWDALIIESARAAGCTVVLSEDLNAGQDYDGVTVRDPFKPTS